MPENGEGKYVYCIIKAENGLKKFGNIGFDGKEVYAMEYKELLPVVSDAVVKEYCVDENEVATHQNVVDMVLKEHSVVPVAYGMVFKTKKLLNVSMGIGYKAMREAMRAVDNRVELGIKVLQPKESPVSRETKLAIKAEFMDTLKKAAFKGKEMKLFSERLILNSSFLVDRGRINDFSGAVTGLSDTHPELKIQYSGPWAPYNFVDIHILSKKRKGGFR